jgi:hypothetical protein
MSVRTTSTLAAGLLGMWALTAMSARALIAASGVFGLLAAGFGLYIPDSLKVRIRHVAICFPQPVPCPSRLCLARSTHQHDVSRSRRRSVLPRRQRAAEAEERTRGGSHGEG